MGILFSAYFAWNAPLKDSLWQQMWVGVIVLVLGFAWPLLLPIFLLLIITVFGGGKKKAREWLAKMGVRDKNGHSGG